MNFLTVDLEKQMLSTKEHNKKAQQEQLILDEANKILAEVDDAKRKVLERIGLAKNLTKSEEILKRKEALSSYDESRVFHRDEIQSICVSYGLRFLPSEYYKGTVDPQLPGKILEFEKVHKSFAYNQYCIAAPKASFHLSPRPKDPLFFANLGGGQYYLVHKWGEDISALNWFKNLPIRNTWTCFFSILLSAILLVGVGNKIINPTISFTELWLFPLLIGGFVGALAGGLTLAEPFGDFQTNKNNWNSNFSD